jgi:formiminotetrahydrofolate cyclodeaminase
MKNRWEFYDKPFAEIIALTGSRSHVPGGGSVSAMAGALGAAMGSMVASLTVGKKGLEAVSGEAREILDDLQRGIEKLKMLTLEDMNAFDGLISATRLPCGTEEEGAAREDALQINTLKAAAAPLNIALCARDMLKLNLRLSEIANASALSDSAVSAIILEAAVRASVQSVDVNLANIKDTGQRNWISNARKEVLEESGRYLHETISIVCFRQNNP